MISCIAVFQGKLSGYVKFIEKKNYVRVEVNVSKLPKGKNGIHIHEKGNLLVKDCKGCKGHFNPYNKNHGDKKDKERHVGDLGNIESIHGQVKIVFRDNLTNLTISGILYSFSKFLISFIKFAARRNSGEKQILCLGKRCFNSRQPSKLIVLLIIIGVPTMHFSTVS